MPIYNIYFELYKKKMKATITAPNTILAKHALYDKIKFYKIDEIKSESDLAFEHLKDILNLK